MTATTIMYDNTLKCRTCLKEHFDGHEINKKIKIQFFEITQIEICLSETSSNSVCLKCMQDIKNVFFYRKSLIKKQDKLKQMLIENISDTVIEERISYNEDDKQEDIITYDASIEYSSCGEEFFETITVDQNSEKSQLDVKEEDLEVEPFLEEVMLEEYDDTETVDEQPIKKSRKNSSKSATSRRKRTKLETENTGRILCPDCGKDIVKEYYKRHQERIHQMKKDYSCDVCEKDFYLKNALENHVRLHLNQRPFNCDIEGCGKSFASKLVLHSHKQYFHMKMPRKCYICEICAKPYKQKHLFDEHMRSRHTGERKFVCDHPGCLAGYFSSGALQQHKSASHSTQEVSCEFCGKCYRSAFNLRAHLRLSHREGTIPCELCDKKFITDYYLTRHMKVHLGQKDYLCDHCDMRYYSKKNLNRHVQTVHEKSKFICEIPGCTSILGRKENYRHHVLSVHKSLPQDEMNTLLKKIRDMKPVYMKNEIIT